MKSANLNLVNAAAGLIAGLVFLICGCGGVTPNITNETHGQVSGRPGPGEATFASDDEAVSAMIAAAKAKDHDQVHRILGPAWKELVSGDKVEDDKAFDEFAQRAAEHFTIKKESPTVSILLIGKDDWSFPIPISKVSDGKWFFDTEAGKTEILARRIGDNELSAIEFCREYVKAQWEYISVDHDGSDVLKFAQRILSSPGKMDGLYWDVPAGQPQSPLSHLFAAATTQGYEQAQGHPQQPYYGYHFRILKRQGSDAPGGKYDYIANGNMVGGFGLVAYPTDYAASGIMTFIVNQRGKVYQKDLGSNTIDIARHMTEYNPDDSWTLVNQ